MNTKLFLRSLMISCLAAALLLSACLPIARAPEDAQPGAIYTSAAETIMPQLTLSAGQTAVAQLTQLAQPSAAPVSPATVTPMIPPPSATTVPASATLPPTAPPPTATFTPIPTATTTPTATPTATYFVPTVMPTYLPTATWSPPTATATQVPVPCNAARFIADVTVPDGTVFPPGQAFTKTWRLRNIGSCAWMPGYLLVFHSGDRMHINSTVQINVTVYPGATVDLSVNLIAPLQTGGYRSYWMFSTAAGQLFGIGANANSPFWVDIKVAVAPTPTTVPTYAFDFIQQMCNAAWRSNTGALPCPGNPGSANGAVLFIDKPTLETGKLENEPALMTLPALSADGWISGVYPAYKVQPGDRFTADLGCLIDSIGCDVTFFLSAQIVGGATIDIASWHEVYDGQISRANVDLNFLAGQTVQFVLKVVNHGVPVKATAFWLVPSIRR